MNDEGIIMMNRERSFMPIYSIVEYSNYVCDSVTLFSLQTRGIHHFYTNLRIKQRLCKDAEHFLQSVLSERILQDEYQDRSHRGRAQDSSEHV